MRISDWSSDVCSSDLPEHAAIIVDVGLGLGPHQHARAQDDIAAELAVERIAHVTRIAIVRRRVAQEEGQHRRAGELLKLDPLDTIVIRLEVAEKKFAKSGYPDRPLHGPTGAADDPDHP